MRVKKLEIYRDQYGPVPNAYKGSLQVENTFGEINLRLDDTASAKILAVVAEELVASAKSVGELLTADVVENLPALLREQAS